MDVVIGTVQRVDDPGIWGTLNYGRRLLGKDIEIRILTTENGHDALLGQNIHIGNQVSSSLLVPQLQLAVHML